MHFLILFRIYMVVTPSVIRPNEVVQIFATILRMNDYPYFDMKVSIVQDKIAYAEITTKFERPGSRLMQMKVGNYWKTNSR